MNDREKKAGATPAATASTERREVAVVRILAGGTRQVRSTFHFDDVLTSFSSQEDVFRATLQPLVGQATTAEFVVVVVTGRSERTTYYTVHEWTVATVDVVVMAVTPRIAMLVIFSASIAQVLAGYETTAFAYGQTGTGKTCCTQLCWPWDQHAGLLLFRGRGLVPRTAAAVLEALAHPEFTESTVTVSYLEIYNEELSDLLATAERHPKLDLKDIGSGRGVCCQGLSEVEVHNMDDILEVVRRAQEKRRVAETRVNARSSRSHSIFTMKVRCQRRVAGGELENQGKLHLVDLAGSECAKKGGFIYPEDASQAARLLAGQEEERERRSINQSLLTLGRVITALREGSGRVPYRDSKLTRLLQDALGGRCKTVIIATISPALAAVEETISALSYAEQAAGIKNRPVASSLLRTATVASAARAADVSSSSGLGASDWAELEMKVTYLAQELEEAQVALGRKYQEAQEEAERAARAEARMEGLAEELRKAKLKTQEQAFAKERFASCASDQHQVALGLQTALSVSEQHAVDLEQRIAIAKEQHRAAQARAKEMCRSLEEGGARRLQELLPLPRPEVTKRLTQEKEGSLGGGPREVAETEAVILETSSAQKAAMLELKELHHRQRCCLVGLGEQLQGPHRSSTHEALQELSAKAKESLVEGVKDAQTTLGSLELALQKAAQVAAEGAGSVTKEAEEAQRSFAEHTQQLQKTLASQRRALAASAARTSEALKAACEAVSELSALSDASLAETAHAVTGLQAVHEETRPRLWLVRDPRNVFFFFFFLPLFQRLRLDTVVMFQAVAGLTCGLLAPAKEILQKLCEKAKCNADAVKEETGSGARALESHQQQKRWDSIAEVQGKCVEDEDKMIQTASDAAASIEEEADRHVEANNVEIHTLQGRALSGVRALRSGAATALEEQRATVQRFVEGAEAGVLGEEIPKRPMADVSETTPVPSEETILAEFQKSCLTKTVCSSNANLVQSVAVALRSSRQGNLDPAEITNIESALRALDIPAQERPVWAAGASRGLFLVFEGLDRSGKSTQSKKIANYLEK
ncbi:Klp61F, partial [Symbiodinium sp. CCMP2456]